jgi:acyl-CoA synthetase (NDP forming)
LELFKTTAAYDLLAGNVRGHERVVSDGELIRCFRAFISIARHFCVDRGEEGPDIGELEVNPFAYRHQRLVPLDGLACLRTATKAGLERPAPKVAKLLEPKSMAIVGVSATAENFGRIILRNVLRAGFDPSAITIVHERESEIEGVRCIPSLKSLTSKVDLLVIAAPSASVPGLINDANAFGLVESGIIISGGLGETEGSTDLGAEVAEAILRGRESGEGAVFLGPNCMGVQSRPGRYDTFFIPEDKIGPIPKGPESPVAIISQSGAFVISRASHLQHLKPRFAITLGNQTDVTVSDLVSVLSPRPDIQVIGVYLEGFADLDGALFVHRVREATDAGKTVVFYKGGRTDSGSKAAAGHTAENFEEFGQLLELASLLAEKETGAGRVFAITNAGMEAVALADALGRSGSPDALRLPESLESQLRDILVEQGLAQLVSPRNPMDLTPMANERAYGAIAEAALAHLEVDALIISCVPLTPQLKTSEDEMAQGGSLAELIPAWARPTRKPILFVMDAGVRYDSMANAIRAEGVPVFRTADAAGRALMRYMGSRKRVEVATEEQIYPVPDSMEPQLT